MRALVVMSLLLGGCSFAFVSAPPKNASPAADCTESYVAPGVDAALTAGAGAAAIAGLASGNNCSSGDCTASNIGQGVAHTAGALMLIPTLIFAISAYSGFSDVGACRRLHATHPQTPAPPNPDLI